MNVFYVRINQKRAHIKYVLKRALRYPSLAIYFICASFCTYQVMGFQYMGCSRYFFVPHIISCRHRGLAISHNNEVHDELLFL